jgi:uncharacterized protein with HEPN domain
VKNAERLTLWIEQMQEAAGDACRYVDGLDFASFERDKRTQQAVVLNLFKPERRMKPPALFALG